jgi:(2Fe-2S) ferredoxin
LAKLKKISAHVLVCRYKTCLKQGAKVSARALKKALKAEKLSDQVMVTKVKCLDQCGRGPIMVVYPDGVWYGGVNAERAGQIVTEHLAEGRRIDCITLRDLRDRGEGQTG